MTVHKPVLFSYVQHLWGVGHVYRASRIAAACTEAGFDVHLIWGGTYLPGFEATPYKIHYLPPIRTKDVSFSTLLHGDVANCDVEEGQEREFSECDMLARKNKLLALFDEISPDILMTEAYPFGRRQVRFELRPLLEHAISCAKRPVIAASVRDILQEGRKQKRVEETLELIDNYYDAVLVHGDEKLVRLEDTVEGVEHFADKIHYTGLVVPPEKVDLTTEKSEDLEPCNVLVSVGGGAFGYALAKCAQEALQHSKQFREKWRLIAGTQMPEHLYQDLVDNCPSGMEILRHVPDMVAQMKVCEVSVSHAGYNTVADILRSGCKSVIHPYTEGGETEQARRAAQMQQKGLALTINKAAMNEAAPAEARRNEVKLAAKDLAEKIDEAALLTPAAKTWNLDGASSSAAILLNFMHA